MITCVVGVPKKRESEHTERCDDMPEGARSMAFLDPLERIAFQIAIRNKQPEFKTKIQGLILKLDYNRKPGLVWFEPKEPVKGVMYIPCGWLNREAVLDNVWIRS